MNRDVKTCAEWALDGKGPAPEHVLDAARRLLFPAAAPAKALPASIVHHDQVRREEELEAEHVSEEVWTIVLARTARDHRMRHCCEACHKERPLEPHHLVLGSREDAPYLVMALCADCHRLGRDAAHRQPRRFAVIVVIPWAEAHHCPLPARKEYRL